MLRESKDYNSRLFQRGIRKWFHLQRFIWTRKQLLFLIAHKPIKILDFGCFDGRLATYLPNNIDFIGVDANWEGGLDQAKKVFKNAPNRLFIHANHHEWKLLRVDCITSLETLEHIPEEELEVLIENFSRMTDTIVVTVPNEIGLLFGIKHIVKLLLYSPEHYTLKEYINQILGRSERVDRDQHKGFNYNHLINLFMKVGFKPILKEGVQFSWLPYYLSPQIGLIFKFEGT